jgi:hypothetical protein
MRFTVDVVPNQLSVVEASDAVLLIIWVTLELDVANKCSIYILFTGTAHMMDGRSLDSGSRPLMSMF